MRLQWVLYAAKVVVRHSWLRKLAFRFAERMVRAKAKEIFSMRFLKILLSGIERAIADVLFAAVGVAASIADRVMYPLANLRPIRY